MLSSTTTLLPLLLSASLLTTALPTASSPMPLTPRACTTLLPSPISVLEASDPTSPLPGSVFRLERVASTDTVSSVVTFNDIPAGSTGCTLAVAFPPHTPGQIAFGSATQADVWTVVADPSGASTWADPPAKEQMVSTVIFPTVGSAEASGTNLWSGTCDESLSFLFELSGWQQGNGSVSFINSASEGFSLVFDC